MPHSSEIFDIILQKDFPLLQHHLATHPAAIIATGRSGDSPLHYAARMDFPEGVTALINAGADVNACNKKYETPLYAAITDHCAAAANVLADRGATANPCFQEGIIGRSLSRWRKFVEMKELNGCSYNSDLHGQLRLWTAVLRGDLDELRRRIDAGDSVDQAPQGGKANDWTALWLAVALGREDAARMLAGAGADVNAVGQGHLTPVAVSVLSNNLSMLRLLIDCSANLNVRLGSGSLLHTAIKQSERPIIITLLEGGADPNILDSFGWTPLLSAVFDGNLAVASLLLGAGADPCLRNQAGDSALHIAITSQNIEMIELLLEHPQALDVVNKDNLTPFGRVLASLTVNFDFVTTVSRMMIDAGATIDFETAKISPLVPSDVIRAIVPEDTPFWLAANNDAPMLAAELADGLDPNMKTENGMTLLHWACAGDAPECVQLLLDAGANTDTEAIYPIFYCIHETSDCLDVFLRTEHDVNHVIQCQTPIHYAVAVNSPACVASLVRAGAWVASTGTSERYIRPVVEKAITTSTGCDALRTLLVLGGSTVINETVDGMKPLYYAIHRSTVEVVQTLVEFGADPAKPAIKPTKQKDALDAAQSLLEQNPLHAQRLYGIIDYLKHLPCFTQAA